MAQRRRRVFALFDFGGVVDPAAVLFERDSLRGNTPPRSEARETVAALSANGVDASGADDNQGQAGHLIPSTGDTSYCLNAGGMGRQDFETETLIAHSLRAEGFDASEDGTGRGTPLVPVASFPAEMSATQCPSNGDVAQSLSVKHSAAIAIQERAVSENPDSGPGGAGYRTDDAAYTLEARTTPQGVAYDMRGRDGGAQFEGPHDTANIRAASGGSSRSYIAHPWAVRRLTPRECERLQGFPDDHTLIRRDRKRALRDLNDELSYLQSEYPDLSNEETLRLAADGPRYKALGNSMAVPVIRWIMNRIRASHKINMERIQ